MAGLLGSVLAVATIVVPADDLRPGYAARLSAERDVAVWTVEGRDGRWRLVARRGDGRPRLLLLAPERGPFSADLGTDADGRLVVVFARCAAGGRCDVHWAGVDRPTPEAAVPAASTPRVDEGSPSVSRGRVAWASQAEVLLGDLRRETRRRLLDAQATSVDQLELSGDALATVATVEGQEGGGGQTVLRTDLRTGRTRVAGTSPLTANGRYVVGASFAGDAVAWAVSCADATPRRCRANGRVRRSDGARAQLPPGALVDGFALLPGDRALVARRGRLRTVRLRFARAPAP